jgi:hypothetical protein
MTVNFDFFFLYFYFRYCPPLCAFTLITGSVLRLLKLMLSPVSLQVLIAPVTTVVIGFSSMSVLTR